MYVFESPGFVLLKTPDSMREAGHDMLAEREAKRVRQACQNCRRKKTRCSGEKPNCAFCSRLKQECVYDNGSVPLDSMTNVRIATVVSARSADGPKSDSALAARIALLEARFGFFNASGSESDLFFGSDLARVGPDHQQPSGHRSTFVGPHVQAFRAQHVGGGKHKLSLPTPAEQYAKWTDTPYNRFASLPPKAALSSIVDTYFENCHQQPYSYFVESHFRRSWQLGLLPSSLLMAVVAMAARFSQHPFFHGDQQVAIETYSRIAWAQIFEKSFSGDDAFDITVVQATNMLAVVDFTFGKHKLAWVKIGLGVRFAQSLHLASEPPPGLAIEQRQERILTFWSVYLLDRLVSCGFNRPPTIVDGDCSVRLPSNRSTFADEREPDTLTLQAIHDQPDPDVISHLNHFAHTIIMASALGQIERFSLQKHSTADSLPLWHDRSEYTKIYSLLLSLETYSEAHLVPFSDAIDRWYTSASSANGIDQQRAGHFVFSVVLYHMNQCLLHHPFLLQDHLRLSKARVPPTFLKHALQRGREHAQLLTLVLRVVQKKRLTLASFYAFACTVAGTIHRLYTQHDDPQVAEVARQLFDVSVEFLQSGQDIWCHYPRMASALFQFEPDPIQAKGLVNGTTSAILPSERSMDPSLDMMWNLLDYGWLSDSARQSFPEDHHHHQQQQQQQQQQQPSWLEDDASFSADDKGVPADIVWQDFGDDATQSIDDSAAVNGSANAYDPTLLHPALGLWSETVVGPSQTLLSADMDSEIVWPNLMR